MSDADRKQALVTMLSMQNRMNTRIHEDWIGQRFAWYRAIWIECGELIEHFGYKWWKKQTPDMQQVRLEVIDIWHFGLSALFDGRSEAEIAEQIVAELQSYQSAGSPVLESTEALAAHALNHQSFSVTLFWELMLAVGLDFDSLYRQYIGKNVLNFFRQDHGYKEGTYIKQWQGREDNEHLSELLQELDSSLGSFADDVYRHLDERYRRVVG